MTVAIRADASASIGIGHVKRCLSLAEALASCGERVVFVAGANIPPALAAQVRATCELRLIDPHGDDARAFLAALGSETADCVIVDDYALDSAWHQAVKDALGCRLAAIDDLANRPLRVDVLVDHNLAADHRAKYRNHLSASARVLGGPAYALISPRYAALPVRGIAATVGSIGISLGGTDPAGFTALAVAACRDGARFAGPIEIVTTAANPRLPELRDLAARTPGVTVSVDLPDLTEFHQRHDLYIGAGGGSSWERCCLGVPVLLLEVAGNQRQVIAGLVEAGAAISLPLGTVPTVQSIGTAVRQLLDDAGLRRGLSSASRKLVDGQGALRVAATLLAPKLTVRPATRDDARRIYDWRNHPRTRSISRDARAIDWPDHCSWVERVLADPRRLLLVGCLGDMPVGVIRFDRLAGEQAEVSLYLDPALHGTGLGGMLLRAGEQAALRWVGGPVVFVAHVLCDNKRSGRMFEGAGYLHADGNWTRRAVPAPQA